MAKSIGMQVSFSPADSLCSRDISQALTEIQKQLDLGATAGNVKVGSVTTSGTEVLTEAVKCRVKWSIDGDVEA